MQAVTWGFLVFSIFWESQAKSNHGNVKEEQQFLYSKETDNLPEIKKKMFTGYDKDERPYHNVKPLEIQVYLGVSSVSHISEEDMEFQVVVYMRQFWHDPRLAYGKNNTSVILQGDMLEKMWLPDTYIENSVKSVVDKDTKTAFVTANGSVFFSYRSTSIVLANMNFLNYPMDEQTLKIQLYSYAYDSDKILLKWKDGLLLKKELASYITKDVTMVEGDHTFITGVYTTVIFQFKVRRRLGYFMLQFYFPCVLSVLVSWLPFWMDRYEIGDRVSLGITTLLTEVFLSQYINSAMPQVSYIKAADEFLLASFIFILMALIESVVVYNVRMDVREKKKMKQVPPPQDKPQHEQRFSDELPLSITDVFRELNTANERNPKQACKVTGQQSTIVKTKSRDLGYSVDQLSRIFFPTSYLVFVTYYFGRYLLFNNFL